MLKSPTSTVLVCALALPILAAGCLTDPPRPGADSLIHSINEPPGSNCRYGGVRIESGLDQDGNALLDTNEVSDVSYACGARVDGATSLIEVSAEPNGPNCPEGGFRFNAGLDDNDDGLLDASEIASTAFSCKGDAGIDGIDGTDGINGRDGQDGDDGYSTLIDVKDEPPSAEGECFYGGTRIEAGLDTNRDGALSQDEVTAVQFVCSVPVNEYMTLVNNSQELPGENCEHGGVRTAVGVDDDDNHKLDPGEVDDVTYLCNDVILIPGQTALLVSAPANTVQCPFGGYVLTSGLDADYNGSLEHAEVTAVMLVCDGRDGFVSLSETEEYAGPACSDQGGWRFRTGLDTDYDDTLDASEVLSNSIICNGQDGFLGYDGKNSLIRVTEDTSVCVYGGFEFEVGLDDNENNVLDWGEVESSEYVCDGANGFNSVVEVEEAGPAICPYGGAIFEVGLDLDADGYLDSGEVEAETYICDGYDGYNSLVDVVEASFAECEFGGIVLLVGLDLDEDGFLDEAEIESEAVLCD